MAFRGKPGGLGAEGFANSGNSFWCLGKLSNELAKSIFSQDREATSKIASCVLHSKEEAMKAMSFDGFFWKHLKKFIVIVILLIIVLIMSERGHFSPKLSGVYANTSYYAIFLSFNENQVTMTSRPIELPGSQGFSTNTLESKTSWYKLDANGRFNSGHALLRRGRYDKSNDTIILGTTVLRRVRN